MLSGNWRSILALACVILGTSLAHAQQAPAQESPQVEVGQPAAPQGGVATERQPIPIVIVGAPDYEARALERDQEAIAQAEAGLAAQREAADAAQRAASSAERQETNIFILAVASTVLALTAIGLSLFTALRADKTARLHLRAYVTVDRVDLRDEGGFVWAIVTAKNTGQTPARELRHRVDLVDIEPMEDAVLDAAEVFAMRDIGSGGTQEMSVLATVMGPRLHDQILNGRSRIWLQGVIRYQDIFGVEHFTWFKNVIHGEQSSLRNGEFVMHATPSGDGNHSS